MLYNILPPLIFFISFGGIILVVSRVVMRVRRQEFSHTIRQEVQSNSSVMPEHILNPGGGSVQLLKSRIGVLTSSTRQAFSEAKNSWGSRKERKAQRKALAQAAREQKEEILSAEPVAAEVSTGVTIPRSTWREKAASFFKKRSEQVGSLAEKMKRKTSVEFPEANTTSVELEGSREVERPVFARRATNEIRIMRVEKPVLTKMNKDNNEAAEELEVQEEVSTPNPKEQQAPQGRFIARLKKITEPKPSALQQATDAIASAHYEKAEEILVPYIIDHAKDANAYMLLGKIAVARGAWDEAFEIFQQVVRIDPTTSEAQSSLGYAALEQGKFTIAIQALQRAHEAEPKNVSVLECLLKIAKRMDNRVLQKSVLEQLCELLPEHESHAKDLQQVLQRETTKVSA